MQIFERVIKDLKEHFNWQKKGTALRIEIVVKLHSFNGKHSSKTLLTMHSMKILSSLRKGKKRLINSPQKQRSLTIRKALVSLSLSISMQNCKRLVVFDSTAVQWEICSLNTRALCSRSLRICSRREAFFASSAAIRESIWDAISASNKLVFACEEDATEFALLRHKSKGREGVLRGANEITKDSALATQVIGSRSNW